jgi:hypothetical protein
MWGIVRAAQKTDIARADGAHRRREHKGLAFDIIKVLKMRNAQCHLMYHKAQFAARCVTSR